MTKRKPASLGPSKDIDRRIHGIGRIRVNSGVPDGPQWRAMNDMVSLLARDADGRALLREVYDGRLQIDVLWTHYKNRTLHLIPLGAAAAPLVEALTEWREGTYRRKECSADTYRVRKELVDLTRETKPNGIVSDLPDVIRVLRVQMKGARQFNLVRSYALAFVRDTLTKVSPVYIQVSGVPARKVTPSTRKHPLTPRELFDLVTTHHAMAREWEAKHDSPKATKRPQTEWDDMVVMAYTGMNPREYAGRWTVMADRVRIYGTKRAGRVRDVPYIGVTAWAAIGTYHRPSVSPKVFAKHLRAVSDKAGIPCTPYDLRRTFATWMESAGIPRARRMSYMGHGAKDITDLYERHEVDAYLVEDGNKLRTWLNEQCCAHITKGRLAVVR